MKVLDAQGCLPGPRKGPTPIVRLAILLGEVAAQSIADKETPQQWLRTLEVLRDYISKYIEEQTAGIRAHSQE